MKLGRLERLPPRSVWFIASFDGPPLVSKQLPELFNRQPSVLGNTTHGVGIHGIVARDGEDAAAVTHDDVLALTSDAESGLLKARTALRCGTPGIFGTTPPRRLRAPRHRESAPRRPRGTPELLSGCSRGLRAPSALATSNQGDPERRRRPPPQNGEEQPCTSFGPTSDEYVTPTREVRRTAAITCGAHIDDAKGVPGHLQSRAPAGSSLCSTARRLQPWGLMSR